MDCVTTAFQDHHIACFKTEAKCIGCHIWTRLINNTDHTERHTFLPDQKTVRTFFHAGDFSDRIFKRHKLSESLCHTLDSLRTQHKPVNQSFRHVVLLRICHISCIRVQQLVCRFDQMIGNRRKHLILLVCRDRAYGIFCFFCIHSKL